MPAYDCVAAPDDASFDHAVAGEALELLKMFAQSVRVEEGDEFDAVLFGRVQRTCSILERVKVELDPVSFVKMAKQLQARALVHDTGSSAPYRAAFMVKVMCMSGLLRTSENLAAMLRHSIGLILPPIVQPHFWAARCVQEGDSACGYDEPLEVLIGCCIHAGAPRDES